MSFQDGFTQSLNQAGISIDASLIPDQSSVSSDLDSLQTWLASLEPDTMTAIDQVSGENPVKAGLADPSVAIVSAIGPVLKAVDAAPAAFSISATLAMLRQAFDAGSAEA
ncbi:MAG TPA: hypothetical protein VNT30_24425 [Stellaceae bacterium]|nr:hypothetical protein [Stellaceae bacterium]